ncbi:flagellar protein FlgN [Methylobacterium sp. 1030]|uniref:flagellar protein FlgN n=1 Tax=Methylobacterium sp. 1030 TaxID=3156404 RepID=UPI003398C16F
MLLSTLRRLEATLDTETAALLAHDLSTLDDFHQRKSHSLVELARLGRRAIHPGDDPATLDCLHRVRAKLGRNHEVVGMHLRAMQEVADIVATLTQSAESDGTYSACVRHRD